MTKQERQEEEQYKLARRQAGDLALTLGITGSLPIQMFTSKVFNEAKRVKELFNSVYAPDEAFRQAVDKK